MWALSIFFQNYNTFLITQGLVKEVDKIKWGQFFSSFFVLCGWDSVHCFMEAEHESVIGLSGRWS